MPLTATPITRPNLRGPTILDLLSKIAQTPGDFTLLHSARHHGPSVLACEPLLTLEIKSPTAAEKKPPKPTWIFHRDFHPQNKLPDTLSLPDDPLTAWQTMLDSIQLAALSSEGQRLLIGWLGGLSYDIGRFIENIGQSAIEDTHWPLMRWTLFDAYFVFDPTTRRWTIATYDWDQPRKETAIYRLDRLQHLLASEDPQPSPPMAPARLLTALSPETYRAKVSRTKEYIAAGDIYQANLAQCWTVETADDPVKIYRRLCEKSPSDYATFMRFDHRTVLSASPELFVDREGDQLTTRPIKGTRRRDSFAADRDEALKNELLASAKDKAELAMIVDLLRNDLGRICQFGSVNVTAARELEMHPTVWHTVATLRGILDQPRASKWSDIIRALCPGGSITGAPKDRAMQIIEELEGVRRGWYCGNLGWIGASNTGALNIAIRTILMDGPIAQVWAGGGIVADSDPTAEYEESCVKASAMLESLGVHTANQ